jgi:flagellar L-ring protein precursor FlgH
MNLRKPYAALFPLGACLVCLAGCASGKGQVTAPSVMTETQGEAPLKSVVPPYAAEANLLRDSQYSSLFQDLSAHRVGDLVTINIVETSKASKKADTKTGRNSSIDASVEYALGDNDISKNMFKSALANQFNGTGSTSRDETMTAAITARVLDVLPNGNLYIEGTRQIRVNNETQYITLSGIIRPVDISPNNTVLSSYIANARIDYTGSGPVSDKQRPGWLTRILDFAWPF